MQKRHAGIDIMEAQSTQRFLRDIPLFAALDEDALVLVAQKSRMAEYAKGSVMYREGAAPDAFYCIIAGRVVIYTTDTLGREQALEYLHRGKYFGIISLLTGEPHSVTARALNDCTVLTVAKDDFNELLKGIPSLAIDLSKTLSRRLKNKDIHQKIVFESTILSVFSSYAQAGKSIYALNLALSLKKETSKPLILLEVCPEDKLHSLPQRLRVEAAFQTIGPCSWPEAESCLINFSQPDALGKFTIKTACGIDVICFSYAPDDESFVKKLLDVMTFLINDYAYIILDLPASMDAFVLSVLNQSDLIQVLTSPEPVDLKRTRRLIERLKSDFHFPESKISVIINEYKLSKLTSGEQKEILGHAIFATVPRIEFEDSDKIMLDQPESEYAKVVRRIARHTGECLVGLALGVGAGYGFCHIGVLKVLEEEKIPIDVITGSSIGAIIASLWVTGRSASEILEITREFKKQSFVWKLADFTFPSIGFIKGNRLYDFLKKYLGTKTFHDVSLPLKIIASDIKRKEPRVLDKGLLADALMASCAMPGIFRPFKFRDDILFDGGVTNPLPTEELYRMGMKKIIAVNVTPSRQDIIRQYEELKTHLSPGPAHKKRKWFSLRRYFQQRLKNNILEIIFSSIELMQSELVEKEAELADVLLHPDTSGLHWMEFHRAEEFASRGEQEARRQIEKIKQLVNE